MAHWKRWLIVGVIAILGGFFALLDPFRNLELQVQALSVALEYFVGWLFVVVGGATAVLGFHPHHTIRWRVMPIGVAVLLVGILLLMNPTGGERLFTILLAIALIGSGIFKALLGYEWRSLKVSSWIMVAGAVSAIVGLLVFIGFPLAGNLTLAFFLALDMIATGIVLVMVAFWHRNTQP